MPRHLFCVRFINLNLAVFRARKIPHNRKCTMQAGRPVPCRSGLVFGLVWFGLAGFSFRCESGFGSDARPRCGVRFWGRGRRVVGVVMCLYISWNDRNWIKFMRFTRRRSNRIWNLHAPRSETRNRKKKKIEIGGRKHTFPPCNVLGCRNFGFEICAKVAWCVLAAKCFLFDAVFQKSRQRLRAKCKTLKFRTLMHCSASNAS